MPKFQAHEGVPHRAANGACFFCRQSKKDTYVRTYTDIEFTKGEGPARRTRDGEIAICKACTHAIGGAVGMASARSNEATKLENARVREENKALKERVGQLEELERAVKSVTNTFPDDLSHIVKSVEVANSA